MLLDIFSKIYVYIYISSKKNFWSNKLIKIKDNLHTIEHKNINCFIIIDENYEYNFIYFNFNLRTSFYIFHTFHCDKKYSEENYFSLSFWIIISINWKRSKRLSIISIYLRATLDN